MDGKRRWFGWVAIGLGALALLVALRGRGFGPQIGAAGRPGANVQQQNAGPQGGPAGPGGEARRGAGRQADGGFGLSGWLRFPFKLIGGSFQWGMLALLIGLGVWMIRGRSTGAALNSRPAEPAQGPPPEPLSPTGESYIDEPSDRE